MANQDVLHQGCTAAAGRLKMSRLASCWRRLYRRPVLLSGEGLALQVLLLTVFIFLAGVPILADCSSVKYLCWKTYQMAT